MRSAPARASAAKAATMDGPEPGGAGHKVREVCAAPAKTRLGPFTSMLRDDGLPVARTSRRIVKVLKRMLNITTGAIRPAFIPSPPSRATAEEARFCVVSQHIRTSAIRRGLTARRLTHVLGELQDVQENAGGRKPPGRNPRRRT